LIFDYRGTFRLTVPASGGKQDAVPRPKRTSPRWNPLPWRSEIGRY